MQPRQRILVYGAGFCSYTTKAPNTRHRPKPHRQRPDISTHQTSPQTRHHHRPNTTKDQTPAQTKHHNQSPVKSHHKKTPPQTRHNQTYQRRPRTKHHKTCVSKRRPFLLMLITRPPPHHRASASETLNCPLFYPPIQADFITTNSSVIRHFGKNRKHLNIERFCDMIKLT